MPPLEHLVKNMETYGFQSPDSGPPIGGDPLKGDRFTSKAIYNLHELLNLLDGKYQTHDSTLLSQAIIKEDPPDRTQESERLLSYILRPQQIFDHPDDHDLLVIKRKTSGDKTCFLIAYDRQAEPSSATSMAPPPFFKTNYAIFQNGSFIQVLLKELEKSPSGGESRYSLIVMHDQEKIYDDQLVMSNPQATAFIPLLFRQYVVSSATTDNQAFLNTYILPALSQTHASRTS